MLSLPRLLITIAQWSIVCNILHRTHIHLPATSFLRAAYGSKGKGCRTVAAQQPTDRLWRKGSRLIVLLAMAHQNRLRRGDDRCLFAHS
jgi:hypothetical protein